MIGQIAEGTAGRARRRSLNDANAMALGVWPITPHTYLIMRSNENSRAPGIKQMPGVF